MRLIVKFDARIVGKNKLTTVMKVQLPMKCNVQDGRGGKTFFVVQKKPKRPGEGEKVWIFSKHEDALRCRQEQKIDSNALWGCAVDCYQSKQGE